VLNVPCSILPHATLRPQNGAIIVDFRPDLGLGELEISNGTEADGFVLLTTLQSEPVYGCYVQANSQATLSGIPDGEYSIFFSTGEDWDAVDLRFTADADYTKFEESIDFQTTTTQYSIWSITLHTVSGGAAETESIPAEDFPGLLLP
jgi:hypothetical protein